MSDRYCIDRDDMPDIYVLARVVDAVRRLTETLDRTGLRWWQHQPVDDDEITDPPWMSADHRVLRWVSEALVEGHEQLVDAAADEDHRLYEYRSDLAMAQTISVDVENALRTLHAVATPLDRIIMREFATTELTDEDDA